MGIFRRRNNTAGRIPTSVYIVEDNALYARHLEFFLKSTFGTAVTVECFPVSEVIEVKLDRGQIPNVIIMDHNLNDKYEDAASGLESAQLIHDQHPEIQLILHTARSPLETGIAQLPDSCEYVPKGEGALQQLEKIIRRVMEQQS